MWDPLRKEKKCPFFDYEDLLKSMSLLLYELLMNIEWDPLDLKLVIDGTFGFQNPKNGTLYQF